ncbi:class I SAM-dependent methyltransferase [bacterium]|nr:MAG: class I SAM-dependent methyltransferase [bacterium]
MSTSQPTNHFTESVAAQYDQKFIKLAPMRDVLQLSIRILFSDLPPDAHILCVGVGTGLELVDLANEYPGFRFTALEPSAPMLDICRQRAQEHGITERCTFHEGYIDSLPHTTPYDAATCLLVSHFITDYAERQHFFAAIASHLKQGAYFVNADLATDSQEPAGKELVQLWMRVQNYSQGDLEKSPQEIDNMLANFEKFVALLPPQRMEELLRSSGFESPLQILQTVLIYAWFSRRGA